MDSHHRKPYRLRLKDDGVARRRARRLHRGLPPPRHRRPRGADPAQGPLGMSTDDIAAKRGPLLLLRHRPRRVAPDRGRRVPTPASSSAPRPVEQVRDVADGRRDDAARSPPTSSRSCSPGSSSTRSPTPATPRDEDLHAQGRRRHHRPLVRRPPLQVGRADRGLRRDRRGRLGARRRPLALLRDGERGRGRRRRAAPPARAVRRRRRAGDGARGLRPARGRRQPGHRRDGRLDSRRRSTATWTASTCRRSS